MGQDGHTAAREGCPEELLRGVLVANGVTPCHNSPANKKKKQKTGVPIVAQLRIQNSP